jgi:ubiquitin-protein ligase E3 B
MQVILHDDIDIEMSVCKMYSICYTKTISCPVIRYLVSSLESDSIKLSYIGVALNKEHAIAWIAHMKDILWKCCCYLDELQPEFQADMRTILLYLHTLVAFTSTNTWILLRAKHMEVLKPGLNQLCANMMGHLITKGFYVILKVLNM